jgi:phenylpyruvate tautomerase PptA (4-oxalocrotonate tautomerase family)
MPLVRISLQEGKPDAYRTAIGDAVHRAMVETINVPAQDRFQIITEHPRAALVTIRTTSASAAPTTSSSCRSHSTPGERPR